jgi:hypothetical protein
LYFRPTVGTRRSAEGINRLKGFELNRVLEIALGVFVGALGALTVIEAWHTHKETLTAEGAKVRAEMQAQARREESEKLKGLMGEQRTETTKQPPAEPDDADVPDDPEDEDVESEDTAHDFESQSKDEDVEELDEEDSPPAH